MTECENYYNCLSRYSDFKNGDVSVLNSTDSRKRTKNIQILVIV